VHGLAHRRGADDARDIAFLVKHLGLASVADALDVITRYYPEDRVPPRARYLLEDVLAAIEKGPAG
jgi:hypothetical protein